MSISRKPEHPMAAVFQEAFQHANTWGSPDVGGDALALALANHGSTIIGLPAGFGPKRVREVIGNYFGDRVPVDGQRLYSNPTNPNKLPLSREVRQALQNTRANGDTSIDALVSELMKDPDSTFGHIVKVIEQDAQS